MAKFESEAARPDASRLEVSIIVPFRDASAAVLSCADALLQQKTHREYEIVFVDDGSQLEEAARGLQERCNSEPRLQLLHQEPRGPAAARNTGVKQAGGKYLLFTDSDCEPTPEWLEEMCKPLDEGAAGVKGVYRSEQDSWVARLVQVEYEEKYNYMDRFDEIDFIDTYAAGFQREVFERYGGFDERFPSPSVEDQEFSFRLAAGGERMRFARRAVVTHRHVETLWGYARKKARIAFYKALILRLHPVRTKGDTHTPPSLMFQMPLAMTILVTLAFAMWRVEWLAVSALAVMAFIGTCRHTIAQARQKAPDLQLRVPLLMLVRAAGLAFGLACGLTRFTFGGLPGNRNEDR